MMTKFDIDQNNGKIKNNDINTLIVVQYKFKMVDVFKQHQQPEQKKQWELTITVE